jgi:3D (Asp-Asp-Asp) domain-containing protein
MDDFVGCTAPSFMVTSKNAVSISLTSESVTLPQRRRPKEDLMKHFIKRYIVSATLISIFFMPTHPVLAAPPPISEVKVQVNEHLLPFPDAQPFVDGTNLLQIPIRTLSSKLDYETSWEHKGEAIKIILKNKTHTLSFTTGEHTALLNGEAISLDSPPQLINETAYIPFRDLAEALGIRIQWDSQNRIAILNQDGQYHAPSWYAPSYKTIQGTATAYTGSSSENGGYEGRDYFGNPLTVGTISVDPTVIPLGSKVYIEGYRYDGLPAGGMFATATDTGGAIKGNKIDIFVPDHKEKAIGFGIQQVNIFILEN